jgi:hypothetical protein
MVIHFLFEGCQHACQQTDRAVWMSASPAALDLGAPSVQIIERFSVSRHRQSFDATREGVKPENTWTTLPCVFVRHVAEELGSLEDPACFWTQGHDRAAA